MLQGRDFTVDDIVQHVIEKALSGERNWKPELGPLFPWLKSQINSVMDAWIKRESGKQEVSFGDDNQEDLSNRNDSFSIEIDVLIDKNSPQPETVLLEEETTITRSKAINQVFQAVAGDTELEELIDAIIETGSSKPAVIANYMHLEISEINNRKKRFQRRLDKI